MDAVMFQKEWARMCNSYDDCKNCPLRLNGCSDVLGASGDIVEKRVEIVEKWSREHPLTTNGMKVLEFIHGNVRDTTIIKNYPSTKDYVEICVEKSWWDAEYKRKTDVE